MTSSPIKREFLQLAHEYNPEKPPRGGYDFSGWYVSEKLDGIRCFWDGGLTRGLPTMDVPWASVIDPKKGNIKAKIKPFSTGLWSRYGNPIQAPEWFLNGLPTLPLDGELFAGRGLFQTTTSITRKDTPIDEEWRDIQFAVYSSPPLEHVFGDGRIKNSGMVHNMEWVSINAWITQRLETLPFAQDFISTPSGSTFDRELNILRDALATPSGFAYLHKQVRLPETHDSAVSYLKEHFDTVLGVGGEGLIMRSPNAIWYPKRMRHILKYKPTYDAEAVITGFTSGRVGKQGRLQGKIGAIITEYDSKRLEIAGLTNEEREFLNPVQSQYASENPGVDMPADYSGRHFKVGDVITFKYRELSDIGIPKDARYFRHS